MATHNTDARSSNGAPSPLEIIDQQHWNHALCATFALSLSFFESYVLRKLSAGGCRPWVVVDKLGYRESLLEGRAGAVGREYRLIPVSLPDGVFHPKFIYLSGPDGDVLLVGSGNLTFGGFGRNLEVVEVLQPNSASQVFADFAEFLTILDTRGDATIPDRDWIGEFAKLATKASRSAKSSSQGPRLLHSLTRPVADQLTDVARTNGSASSLLALSPYFDSDGKGIRTLAEKLAVKHLKIGLPPLKSEPSTFPFSSTSGWKVKVEAMVPDVAKSARPLHAKWIEIACGRRRIVLTGSVNATNKALCTIENVELGVMRVTDARASIVDWKPAPIPKERPAIVQPRGDQERLLLIHAIVSYGGYAKGTFIPGKGVAGEWRGDITWSSGRETSVIANVGSDGAFLVELPESDAQILGSSAQISLQQGKRTARGWIQNEAALTLPPQLNPIIRSLGGQATEDDDLALLDYLATHALDYLTSFGRRLGPSRVAPGGAKPPANVAVPLKELAPRPDGSEGEGQARGELLLSVDGAIDRIMTLLRRRLLESDGGVVDDLEEPGGNGEEERPDGTFEIRARQVRREKEIDSLDRFDRRMRNMLKEVSEEASGQTARAALLVLWLDVKLSFVLKRLREPVRARFFLQEWFSIATEQSVSGPGSEALREHAITTAVLLAAESTGKEDADVRPGRLREQLEASLGPGIDRTEAEAIFRDDPLASFAKVLLVSDPPPRFDCILQSMWSVKTVREQLAEAMTDYKAGNSIDRTMPIFAGGSGARLLEALERPSRIPWVKELVGNPNRCVHCGESLGGDQKIDLVQRRFAKCIQCNKYTVWLGA